MLETIHVICPEDICPEDICPGTFAQRTFARKIFAQKYICLDDSCSENICQEDICYGYGVYCKETNIEKHYIDKNVAIYAAELTAIETATELISRKTISKVLTLTDSLTACHIHNKVTKPTNKPTE
jgi:hypothetical protein